MWDVITQHIHVLTSMVVELNCLEVWAWVSIHIILIYMAVITYPNPDAGLANLCY